MIENKTLADEIVGLYDGYHALSFEDVMSYRTETWQASDTIRNIHVNPSRRSLKAIVCLFRTDNESTENFEYPNIERVRITADGLPGAIYNHGIPNDKLFLEAKKESQISIEIKKKPTESNVTCHVFLVSDGVAEFEGADLEGIFV